MLISASVRHRTYSSATTSAQSSMATKEGAFLALRLRYNSAYTAHQSCLQALAEISTAPPDLLAQEAKALAELAEARRNLLAAMTDVAKDGLDA
jgi:hypothetical protein